MTTRRNGTITQRGRGVYQVRWKKGLDADGNRARGNHTVRGTKREAQDYLDQQLRQLDSGVDMQAGARSFGVLLDAWSGARRSIWRT